MARKSRKQLSLLPCESIRPYRAALYTRISVENERKREADSMGNQLELLRDFAHGLKDVQVVDVYCDDDISGTDFNRPQFARMMADIREGKINCVIVKDLSRLGRNYLEAGEYLEMVFPFLGVRFLSVSDGFDSNQKAVDETIQLKNWMNERYAVDISQKICSSMRSLQKKGKFVGGRAPYGYLRDPEDKHHLIPDPAAATIVREIFSRAAKGDTLHGLARDLNRRNIPSPGRHCCEMGLSSRPDWKNSLWSQQSVRRILTDPVYLGHMVGGKTRSSFFLTGQKGASPVASDQLLRIENTHSPLIEKTLFSQVQSLLSPHLPFKGTPSLTSQTSNFFRGRLRCGECGRSLQLRRKKRVHGDSWWYFCPLHENYGSDHCSQKAIKKEALESLVSQAIQTQLRLFMDSQELIRFLNQKKSVQNRYQQCQKKMKEIRRQLQKARGMKASLYGDLVDGVLSRQDYVDLSENYSRREEELSSLLSALEEESGRLSPSYSAGANWEQWAKQYKNCFCLNATMVETLIEKVVLFHSDQIEITFRCQDEFARILDVAKQRKKEEKTLYAG